MSEVVLQGLGGRASPTIHHNRHNRERGSSSSPWPNQGLQPTPGSAVRLWQVSCCTAPRCG